MTKPNAWKVSVPQWHVDPVTGDITVTANVSVDGKMSGEVSYTIAPPSDGTETVGKASGMDLGRFSVSASESWSSNEKTHEIGHDYAASVSRGVETQLGPLKVNANASLNLLRYSEHEKPTAVDPRVRIYSESLMTGIGISASVSKGNVSAGHGESLVTFGANKESIQGNADFDPILQNTTGTIGGLLVPESQSLLQMSAETLQAKQEMLKTLRENYEINLKGSTPGTGFADYYARMIGETSKNERNVKLAEVYVVAEEAEQSIRGGEKSWQRNEFEGGERVLFRHESGKQLYIDRLNERATYHRGGGEVESFSYTNPHQGLNASYELAVRGKPQLHVGDDGWAMLDTGKEQLFINRDMLIHRSAENAIHVDVLTENQTHLHTVPLQAVHSLSMNALGMEVGDAIAAGKQELRINEVNVQEQFAARRASRVEMAEEPIAYNRRHGMQVEDGLALSVSRPSIQAKEVDSAVSRTTATNALECRSAIDAFHVVGNFGRRAVGGMDKVGLIDIDGFRLQGTATYQQATQDYRLTATNAAGEVQEFRIQQSRSDVWISRAQEGRFPENWVEIKNARLETDESLFGIRVDRLTNEEIMRRDLDDMLKEYNIKLTTKDDIDNGNNGPSFC